MTWLHKRQRQHQAGVINIRLGGRLDYNPSGVMVKALGGESCALAI